MSVFRHRREKAELTREGAHFAGISTRASAKDGLSIPKRKKTRSVAATYRVYRGNPPQLAESAAAVGSPRLTPPLAIFFCPAQLAQLRSAHQVSTFLDSPSLWVSADCDRQGRLSRTAVPHIWTAAQNGR